MKIVYLALLVLLVLLVIVNARSCNITIDGKSSIQNPDNLKVHNLVCIEKINENRSGIICECSKDNQMTLFERIINFLFGWLK